jgi:hypothetical protein
MRYVILKRYDDRVFSFASVWYFLRNFEDMSEMCVIFNK